MQKKVVLIIIGVVLLVSFIGIFNEDNSNLENSNNNEVNVQEDAPETNEELNALFGDVEGKTNSFINHEKTIRKFVTDYNKVAQKKVTEVDWQKNHQIADLKFGDLSGKINTGGNVGFLIEFQFSNGKEKLNDYKLLIKDIFKVIDKTFSEDSFERAFNEALKNEFEEIAINDNNFIKLHYNEEPVGYLQGDIYFIDISSNIYE